MLLVAVVLSVAVAMIVVERIAPGRDWPRVATWWARAVLLNGVQIGTFLNPKRFAASCGFGDAEQRLGEMLLCRDVLATRGRPVA